MYSHSLKWVSPEVKVREQHKYYNKARSNVCPNSTIWPLDYNVAEHKEVMKKLREQQQSTREANERKAQELSSPIRKPMSSAISATPEQYTTNRSAVLLFPTVFVPASEARQDEPADWPCKEEMDYEGDSRIKTERLHTRMLPAPRVKGNDTVSWQQRSFAAPEAFDDFRATYDEVSVFLRANTINDCEPTDEEGRYWLGNELMNLLDPVDCL